MTLQCSINGEDFPGTLNNRGVYQFIEPEQRIAGDGTSINAGGHSVIWRWSYISMSEWSWLMTQLLGGSRSLAITSASLYINNTLQSLGTFNSGIVYMPDSRTFRHENYSLREVELRIEHLLPIVSYPSTVWTVGTSDVEGSAVVAYS